MELLSFSGSLPYHGTLKRCGSFIVCDTVGSDDSLQVNETFNEFGSFYNLGTFKVDDSLQGFGAIAICGSLDVLGVD